MNTIVKSRTGFAGFATSKIPERTDASLAESDVIVYVGLPRGLHSCARQHAPPPLRKIITLSGSPGRTRKTKVESCAHPVPNRPGILFHPLLSVASGRMVSYRAAAASLGAPDRMTADRGAQPVSAIVATSIRRRVTMLQSSGVEPTGRQRRWIYAVLSRVLSRLDIKRSAHPLRNKGRHLFQN